MCVSYIYFCVLKLKPCPLFRGQGGSKHPFSWVAFPKSLTPSDAEVKLVELEGMPSSRRARRRYIAHASWFSVRIGFRLEPVPGMAPVCLKRPWPIRSGQTFRTVVNDSFELEKIISSAISFTKCAIQTFVSLLPFCLFATDTANCGQKYLGIALVSCLTIV